MPTTEEWAAHHEARVLRDGGIVDGTNAKQLVIRWPESPSTFVTLEMTAERAARLAAIRAVKPYKYRRPARPNPALARERYLAAGQRAIDSSDSPEPAPSPRARRHTVRVYYTSEGGELLAFDAPGLTEPEATALRDAHQNAEMFPDNVRDLKKPGRGARLVALPSQSAERVKVSTEIAA